MAILDKLAGLGGAVKDTFDRTFGDPSKNAGDTDDDDDDDDAAAPAVLTVEGAWAVLGIAPSATLDDVRASSRALARAQHPGSVNKDEAATTSLARIAEASELLEEHLLPLAPGNAAKPGTTPTSTRARATARATARK